MRDTWSRLFPRQYPALRAEKAKMPAMGKRIARMIPRKMPQQEARGPMRAAQMMRSPKRREMETAQEGRARRLEKGQELFLPE